MLRYAPVHSIYRILGQKSTVLGVFIDFWGAISIIYLAFSEIK
jgi:hypothetical protein